MYTSTFSFISILWLLFSDVWLCVCACVIVCVWWGVLVSNHPRSIKAMHASIQLQYSLQQGLIGWCIHMLWETLHPMPCCAQENQSHTKGDREWESLRERKSEKACRHGFIKPPHQIRKKTAKRSFRSKKLFIVECKSLHDRKEKGKKSFALLLNYTELGGD